MLGSRGHFFLPNIGWRQEEGAKLSVICKMVTHTIDSAAWVARTDTGNNQLAGQIVYGEKEGGYPLPRGTAQKLL